VHVFADSVAYSVVDSVISSRHDCNVVQGGKIHFCYCYASLPAVRVPRVIVSFQDSKQITIKSHVSEIRYNSSVII